MSSDEHLLLRYWTNPANLSLAAALACASGWLFHACVLHPVGLAPETVGLDLDYFIIRAGLAFVLIVTAVSAIALLADTSFLETQTRRRLALCVAAIVWSLSIWVAVGSIVAHSLPVLVAAILGALPALLSGVIIWYQGRNLVDARGVRSLHMPATIITWVLGLGTLAIVAAIGLVVGNAVRKGSEVNFVFLRIPYVCVDTGEGPDLFTHLGSNNGQMILLESTESGQRSAEFTIWYLPIETTTASQGSEC